jgi:hypothetical protein
MIQNKTRKIGIVNEIRDRAAREMTNSDTGKIKSKNIAKWRGDLDSAVTTIINRKLLK